MLGKVVELLRNTDFTRNSGCAKLRKLQIIGQENYPFCKNKNLQIRINGCMIKVEINDF